MVIAESYVTVALSNDKLTSALSTPGTLQIVDNGDAVGVLEKNNLIVLLFPYFQERVWRGRTVEPGRCVESDEPRARWQKSTWYHTELLLPSPTLRCSSLHDSP